MYEDITRRLNKLGSAKRAKASAWFFKTGKGQYGEGDVFIGITVSEIRKVAREFKNLALSDVKRLLQSKIHEYRFVALEILVMQYEAGDQAAKKRVANFYLKNTKHVNNWDLVDTSAPYILGDFLIDQDKKVLYKLAVSPNLWKRRIAIISTAAFISKNKFTDTLKIAEMLLQDKHDLIHKAVGWMLREVGKKSLPTETAFLEKHYRVMPRTMLRYAIEKFPEKERLSYLARPRVV